MIVGVHTVSYNYTYALAQIFRHCSVCMTGRSCCEYFRVRRGLTQRMEAQSPKRTRVWQHLRLITPKKVKCLICAEELAFNDNTSSVMSWGTSDQDTLTQAWPNICTAHKTSCRPIYTAGTVLQGSGNRNLLRNLIPPPTVEDLLGRGPKVSGLQFNRGNSDHTVKSVKMVIVEHNISST